MRRGRVGTVLLLAALLLGVAAPTRAASVYVANDGLDGPSCGAKKSPCRSIRRGVVNAADGDTVIVGPGRYGDLNGDGVLSGPGEEIPTGCSCMLAIDKPVSVVSSDGAAVTIIDARAVSGISGTYNVVLFNMDGHAFGAPGKGFTVTNTSASNNTGILIESSNVTVSGNQVLGSPLGGVVGMAGIQTLAGTDNVVIEGDQVGGWLYGIALQASGNVARKNDLTLNRIGIIFAASVAPQAVGNVVVADFIGIEVHEMGSVAGNAIYGAGFAEVVLDTNPFTGAIHKNDFIGNGCGVDNQVVTLDVTNNYWGAPGGPGTTSSAEDICDSGTGVSMASPFATKPFKVKVRLKP